MTSVMIVDDDFMIADWLEEVLTDAGYEVCGVAGTVGDAIALGERLRPELGVIDMRLPDGGNGTDVATALRRHGRFGVLYATGNAEHPLLNDAVGEGCIAKPFSASSLIIALGIVSDVAAHRPITCALPHEFRLLTRSLPRVA